MFELAERDPSANSVIEHISAVISAILLSRFVVLIYSLTVRAYYIINFASCVKKISSSQKEVERSPPSETSRRIVAVREVFVRNQWLYRGMAG